MPSSDPVFVFSNSLFMSNKKKTDTSENLALVISAKRTAARAERQQREQRLAVLRESIDLWANASTGATVRRRDELLQKKKSAIEEFFTAVNKAPGQVTPSDVKSWCDKLAGSGLRPATIYARVSFVSSFYTWAQRDLELGKAIHHNPATLSRPKAPKPYQTESTKSWTDEELQALVETVSAKASTEDLIGKRDLALLLLYTSTGWRREEVIGLRGCDIRVMDDKLIIGGRVKGGRYRAREVNDEEVRSALLDYLTAARRLHVLKTDAPLWTRHDHPKLAGEPLTSHAFVRNLKRYALEAGLKHVHLHQTRHTFARIVAEETGSFVITQDALEHQNLSTTTVYVQRIAVKKDLHSAAVSRRRRRIPAT
jgi:site-specific recombinase XerD